MNWALAISRNRTALLAVVASIVALLGGRSTSPVARTLRNAALALIRPAEAAARRLIVILARDLVVRARPASAFPANLMTAIPERKTGAMRAGAFRLCDPKKHYVFALPPPEPRGVPRIRSFDAAPFSFALSSGGTKARPAPAADVDIKRLHLRLAALEKALADLPRQARRLARWRHSCRLNSPLRIGRPPGFRIKPARLIDEVLRECHALAMQALRFQSPLPNTS